MKLYPILYSILLFSYAFCSGNSQLDRELIARSLSKINEKNNILDQQEELIHAIINQFKRPITILVVGAQPNKLLTTLLQNRKNSVVLINNNKEVNQMLFHLCTKQNYKNVILLSKSITTDDLTRLSECEHFDLVISLDIKVEFKKSWKDALSIIPQLGFITLLGSKGFVQENHKAVIYGNQVVIQNKEHLLTRPMWLMPKITETKAYPIKKGPYKIVSSTDTKILYKTHNYPKQFVEKLSWLPGINLMTFKMLEGTFPQTNQIKDAILRLRTEPSNDWMPNNMIIQGTDIKLIDCNDPFFQKKPVKWQQRIHRILKLMEYSQPDHVKKIFREHVVRGKATHLINL